MKELRFGGHSRECKTGLEAGQPGRRECAVSHRLLLCQCPPSSKGYLGKAIGGLRVLFLSADRAQVVEEKQALASACCA